MIRFFWRWVKRLALVVVLWLLASIAPIGGIELACRGEPVAQEDRKVLLPPEHHRAETRTYLTYPEWHIVHAYEDYAEVIAQGDPHEFNFFSSIAGFWTSLCALTQVAEAEGEIDWPTKRMVYVIGASFTFELGAKAAYEETLGRLATRVRGDERAPLDDLSAQQAAEYAEFLQQVPWFEWRWREDADALGAAAGLSRRDWERRIALGLEYRAKAVYADALIKAMEGMPPTR